MELPDTAEGAPVLVYEYPVNVPRDAGSPDGDCVTHLMAQSQAGPLGC